MPNKSSRSVRHDAVPLETVLIAARAWATGLSDRHPEIVRIGYFGSYARGDYVPGSDFDVLIEVSHSQVPQRSDRTDAFLPQRFPVGVELFVYTSDEVSQLRAAGSSFLAEAQRHLTPLP